MCPYNYCTTSRAPCKPYLVRCSKCVKLDTAVFLWRYIDCVRALWYSLDMTNFDFVPTVLKVILIVSMIGQFVTLIPVSIRIIEYKIVLGFFSTVTAIVTLIFVGLRISIQSFYDFDSFSTQYYWWSNQPFGYWIVSISVIGTILVVSYHVYRLEDNSVSERLSERLETLDK